ncbi:MAG: ATP-dependent Clp protease regulatory subunit [Parcubacteria group bacterium GW2011_GWC2_45_7]|nr:MAG: ATP-dependent Clp protease regulatory subunit [Parcubacteria group bacterium GW2011_GWC2_45_7]KKU73817.1 MAG: ATP-dependent Clp protease regulatory subunit [Parcubacteria group bacterium GW2011_GWA2_47_26]
MEFLKCEICNGTGVMPGKVCGTCHGAGFAGIGDSQVFYWRSRINRSQLQQAKVERAVRSIFSALLAIFGLSGIGFVLAQAWPTLENIFTAQFWQISSLAKIIFSFSLITNLYLLTRVLRIQEDTENVQPSLRQPLKVVPDTWRDLLKLPKLRRLDISHAYTIDALGRLKDAYILASKLKHAQISPPHIFAGLLSSGAVGSLLTRLELDPKGLQERVGRALIEEALFAPPQEEPIWSEAAKQILIRAYCRAQQVKNEKVAAYHVLIETVLANERLQTILFDLGVDQDKLLNAVRWFEINDEMRRRWRYFRGAAARRPKGAMNRAMTALQTRILDRFSDDLTLLAGRGYLELVVDREKTFEEVLRILEGERKSVLLVGNFGVGKEAILDGIAQRMVENDVPGLLKDCRLVSLSIPKLIAGATPSEAEERLLLSLYDVGRAGNVVLALPNIHGAISGRTAGGLDLGDVLATEMNKGYFLAVATTTPEEYRALIEGSALGESFIKVEVSEPDVNTAIQILESKVGPIEYRTQVFFSYNALEKAVVLSDRYMKDHYLPEKAIDIIKEAAQHVRNKQGAKNLVRGEDVAEIVSQKTGVPATAVTETEAQKLLHLEDTMHERIIGQDEAVRAVAAALRRARAELREVKRPIANFLFLGPTGVGKTETAKTVAEVYFGNEENMIRIDMSEYQDKTSIYRLIGAPGESGGLLTEPVRKNPFSLVLLDEIEKAHPDILNIFLQVMDDGRVTDSAGRVVDFTNTIIIGTSNAGTPFIQESIKQSKAMEEIKKDLVERELKQYFRPEFLNRFDAVIVYKPLTEPEIIQIAKLILAKVGKQLEAKGIMFKAAEEAVAELAHAGFDPLFGARPLRRVIQERVNDALANLLLTQKIGRRDIVILETGGQLRIEKAEKL